MADIRCPTCGTMNPAELEFCQNCQGRLDSAEVPLQPGQAPTKKGTAELEPILPQWLRDARSQARQSAEDEAKSAENQAQGKGDSSIDFLAGLQAQAGEADEDVPAWLGSLTGQSGKGKKVQPEESTEVRWVELGGTEELYGLPGASIPAAQAPVPSADENELPPWLANINTVQEDSSQDTFSGWLKNVASEPASPAKPPTTASLSEEKSPFKDDQSTGVEDAFAGFQSPSANDDSSADWLNKPSMEQSPAVRRPEGFAPMEAGLPDWLKSQQGGPGPARPPDTGELPDWLKTLESTQPGPEPEPPASPTSEAPDWLKTVDADSPSPFAAAAGYAQNEPGEPTPAIPAETPDWLKNLDPGAAADSSAAPSSQAPARMPAETAELTGDVPAESSAWMKALGGVQPRDPSAVFGSPASTSAEISQPSSPAFTPQGGENVFSTESLSKGDLDALFMDMPDWLAATGVEEPGAPLAAENLNVIAPGSLPSWVEAMRPVESSIAQGGRAGDQTLETRGPLAGLHGVLPAVPFLGPSSKPKAYSIKLIASEEQRSHAGLLEEVLAVETTPVPIASLRDVAPQRALRLLIAGLLFIVLAAAVFGGTQLFPLPLNTNNKLEVQRGLESIWAVPENAPVLIVFDYEPALAGEMETLAAPLLDQMLLLRHPRLTLLSTSPAGATLAERLFAGPLAGHNYQAGLQYLNLGYLPGGLSGVRAFAQNPSAAMPFAFNGAPAWQSAPLQDVQALAHFAAIIVLTDNAETGKTWIEQAGPFRGASPLVIAASAQTGPMLRPYFQSGQINGLLTGLYDSALVEQMNAGRPGTARRYWDAYNLGLLFAVAFILGGSLLSLVAGSRRRSQARAG